MKGGTSPPVLSLSKDGGLSPFMVLQARHERTCFKLTSLLTSFRSILEPRLIAHPISLPLIQVGQGGLPSLLDYYEPTWVLAAIINWSPS